MREVKKALIVSYVYPPMAAVGGQRVISFCKYLPRYGWKPVVLTVKGGTNASWDEGLLKLVADDPAAVIDVPHFCNEQGYELVVADGDLHTYFINLLSRLLEYFILNI